MSEQEYPYEALRTFCASKPTEFDAFMRLWKEEHPDPISIAKIVAKIPPTNIPIHGEIPVLMNNNVEV